MLELQNLWGISTKNQAISIMVYIGNKLVQREGLTKGTSKGICEITKTILRNVQKHIVDMTAQYY